MRELMRRMRGRQRPCGHGATRTFSNDSLDTAARASHDLTRHLDLDGRLVHHLRKKAQFIASLFCGHLLVW